MNGSIIVSGLGKAYKKYPNRLARLFEWLDPRDKPRHQLHWVLQDIDFAIKSGEAVGILGVNGAGKSTLLKLITGTIQPTNGTIHISGRVAALLELGTGFHPDFTGRQNAYMAGQLRGYTREEMASLMLQIEAFADIGEYIDQPVRVYSSGMQMRLAYSVATAVRPDILILDEALSVGDAAFQRKCFQRIEAYCLFGTTLLYVSHDIETVKKLCDFAIFINQGRLVEFGQAKTVCDSYERHLFSSSQSSKPKQIPDETVATNQLENFDPTLVVSCELTYGNGKVDIEACWLSDTLGHRINVIETGTRFCWCYRVKFNENVDQPIFAMMMKTLEGITLYGVDSKLLHLEHRHFLKGDIVEVNFTLENPLAPGFYYFNCGVRQNDQESVEFLSRRVDSAILKVTANSKTSAFVGLMEMRAKLSVIAQEG